MSDLFLFSLIERLAFDLFSLIIFVGLLIALAAVLVVPFWLLLPRFQIPAPVAFFSVVPLGALILLWIIALRNRSIDRGFSS